MSFLSIKTTIEKEEKLVRNKINIPDQPHALFLIIVFDLFALVAVYGLYATNWIGQSGYPISLPNAQTAPLHVASNHTVLKLPSQTSNLCIVGNKAIPIDQLEQHLNTQIAQYDLKEVLIMTDKNVPVFKERNIIATVQKLGLQCSLIAEPR